MTFSHKDRPRLAIALGDPAGIGTEVVLKALTPEIIAAADITLFGNKQLLASNYQQLIAMQSTDLPSLAQLKLWDVSLAPTVINQIQPGQENAGSGEAGFQFLCTAIEQTLTGNFEGIVTAPIAKSAWAAAGHAYPGQTELLAEMSGVDQFGMMFVGSSPHTGWQIRMLLATTHIPLRAVSDRLTPQLLSDKLALLIRCLQDDFGIAEPQINVAGLNPHSGEQGWLRSAQQSYPQVKLVGLLPPDTMWVAPGQAWFGTGQQPVADGYLALYHDQGLIPVKLMAFDRAVNTTIGLPFVRTSPDHGTAFDIAGQNKADATSMREAILLAVELVKKRTKLQTNPHEYRRLDYKAPNYLPNNFGSV
jgi:4-hydroxythreonine-4-phosphate dehydrogenase